MSVIFTFPGQGGQRAGMLHALPDHDAAKRTLDETSDVLNLDVLELDTEASLASSFAVQICLLAAGVAMARVLAEAGARPHMVAGLSIGEWPAAVVAGALDYPDAVRLVAMRGRLMDAAYPSGYGMAAISGLSLGQLERLVVQVHGNATPAYVANLNADHQFVVAGADAALAKVMVLARANGATRAQRLAMSVPSHCELLDSVGLALKQAMALVRVQRPTCVYLGSAHARMLNDPVRIADNLALNVTRQVRWSETIRLAWERGARLAVEMPGGSVLSRLTAPVFIDGRTVCCDNNPVDSILSLIGRY